MYGAAILLKPRRHDSVSLMHAGPGDDPLGVSGMSHQESDEDGQYSGVWISVVVWILAIVGMIWAAYLYANHL